MGQDEVGLGDEGGQGWGEGQDCGGRVGGGVGGGAFAVLDCDVGEAFLDGQAVELGGVDCFY